ncbi:hypothetical protein ATANTOWER_018418 [Ataeniobius toweri]|uniref:Uncharacterized protein n=1 Tax=Ataeniobius toweri TaxID=208326 RepID=A0ABU7BHC8_9TELE|nr:hypothetical protein [Ataeniobius toweri]
MNIPLCISNVEADLPLKIPSHNPICLVSAFFLFHLSAFYYYKKSHILASKLCSSPRCLLSDLTLPWHLFLHQKATEKNFDGVMLRVKKALDSFLLLSGLGNKHKLAVVSPAFLIKQVTQHLPKLLPSLVRMCLKPFLPSFLPTLSCVFSIFVSFLVPRVLHFTPLCLPFLSSLLYVHVSFPPP